MMKKTLLFTMAVLFLGYLFMGNGYVGHVGATVPCPTPGGCAGQCNYIGCGDKCHCRGGACGDWSKVCTYCDPDDCEDIFGNDWEEGRCNGAGNCEEERFECNCSNGPHYCHRHKGSSSSSSSSSPPPPSPTPTKPPPSPTPIQPSVIMNMPLPAAKSFSKKAVNVSNEAAQNWICLKTTPCSTGAVTCSGGDKKHRVRIEAKPESSLSPKTKTYVFECLQTAQGYRCTSGNTTLDRELLGAEYLGMLSSSYGYKFVAYTDTKGKSISQSVPSEVPSSGDKGEFGPFEWESSTTKQVGRMMMGVQVVGGEGSNLAGEHGTQKLGTFGFGDNSEETVCVMIKWDPRGVVFDAESLKPLEGVEVTLLRSDEKGGYTQLRGDEVFGGIVNPQLTARDGAFAFYVPDGTYKLTVSKKGYVPVYKGTARMESAYPNMYDGGGIVTRGRLELRNIAMRKENFLEYLIRTVTGGTK